MRQSEGGEGGLLIRFEGGECWIHVVEKKDHGHRLPNTTNNRGGRPANSLQRGGFEQRGGKLAGQARGGAPKFGTNSPQQNQQNGFVQVTKSK